MRGHLVTRAREAMQRLGHHDDVHSLREQIDELEKLGDALAVAASGAVFMTNDEKADEAEMEELDNAIEDWDRYRGFRVD